MLRKQVRVYCSARNVWESRESAWRQLRHDRGLEEWVALLNSRRFTNPTSRRAALDGHMRRQGARHSETRLKLLGQLKDLRPPSSLDSKAVSSVVERFDSLKLTEIEAAADLSQVQP